MLTESQPAVVFDLGKVLLDFDYGIVVDRLAAASPCPREKLDQIFHSDSAMLLRYESGRCSTAEFFQAVRKLTRFDGDLDEFAEWFSDIFFPIDPMVSWHDDLRRRGIPTYLFSNTNELAIRWIHRKFPFIGSFTDRFYSFRTGHLKPEPPSYRVVEHGTGRRGRQIIYIDDRPENVAGGAAMGWHAIHHTGTQSTIQTAETMLNSPE